MRDHDISQRRACRLVGVDPKTVRRERPPDNPEIRKEMKAVAAKRRRFGYRRIGVMLERKGMIMNHKKLYRLYSEEKLGVRRRRGRQRSRGSRTPILMILPSGVTIGRAAFCMAQSSVFGSCLSNNGAKKFDGSTRPLSASALNRTCPWVSLDRNLINLGQDVRHRLNLRLLVSRRRERARAQQSAQQLGSGRLGGLQADLRSGGPRFSVSSYSQGRFRQY
jgi:hypothetical protein